MKLDPQTCMLALQKKKNRLVTLGVPKCYKLSPMPGFIYDLYRSQPARMTLSSEILFTV